MSGDASIRQQVEDLLPTKNENVTVVYKDGFYNTGRIDGLGQFGFWFVPAGCIYVRYEEVDKINHQPVILNPNVERAADPEEVE